MVLGAHPPLHPSALPAYFLAMSHIADRAARFSAITLDELSDADLMRRIDRKFLLNDRDLSGLLDGCLDDYRILEVSGTRLREYLTRYFDTPDLALYHAHH